MVRSASPRPSLRAHVLRATLAVMVAIISLALGAPPARAQSGITSPAPGSAISGDVPIFGTAVIEPFQKYELHYKLEPSGDDAYIYFYGATNPVTNGQLGVWQASALPPGTYSIRLRVVKNDGNYAEFYAPNLSLNLSTVPVEPTPTPTSSEPTPTPIPTATFTPAPQPTPAVGQVDLPGLPPTQTPAPEAVAPAEPANQDPVEVAAAPINLAANNVQPAEAGTSLTREMGEALSLATLRGHFLTGVRISASLLLGVVALYAGKKLFDWVWTQFS